MDEFRLDTAQEVPAPLERVFAFFSDAGNLEAITPGFLKFKILSPRPIEMRVGAVIDYSLRLHGIPVKWRSVITAWEPGVRFVDEQVKGPYRKWVHEHTFERTARGTMVRDHVRYAVPGGRLVERWIVRPRLEAIFAYRRGAIERLITPG